MPLNQGNSRKTLWLLNGVFLFIGALTAFYPVDATLLLLCLPAFYTVQSLALPGWQTVVTAMLPALLAFVNPQLAPGATLYALALICGILMCAAYARRRPALAVALPVVILGLAAIMGLLSMVSFDFNALQRAVEKYIKAMLDGVIAMSPPDQRADLTQGRYDLEARLVGFFPAMCGMTFAFYSWINLLLVNSFRHEIDLQSFRSSDWLLVPFIISAILVLVPGGRLIGLNLLFMILAVYFFQGMAIAATYMDRRRWPRFMKWLVYILMVIQLYIGVAALGLFDTWFDFRKKIGNSEGEE